MREGREGGRSRICMKNRGVLPVNKVPLGKGKEEREREREREVHILLYFFFLLFLVEGIGVVWGYLWPGTKFKIFRRCALKTSKTVLFFI